VILVGRTARWLRSTRGVIEIYSQRRMRAATRKRFHEKLYSVLAIESAFIKNIFGF
jgi:hypothetical protein